MLLFVDIKAEIQNGMCLPPLRGDGLLILAQLYVTCQCFNIITAY